MKKIIENYKNNLGNHSKQASNVVSALREENAKLKETVKVSLEAMTLATENLDTFVQFQRELTGDALEGEQSW